jgi:hypothetical protein
LTDDYSGNRLNITTALIVNDDSTLIIQPVVTSNMLLLKKLCKILGTDGIEILEPHFQWNPQSDDPKRAEFLVVARSALRGPMGPSVAKDAESIFVQVFSNSDPFSLWKFALIWFWLVYEWPDHFNGTIPTPWCVLTAYGGSQRKTLKYLRTLNERAAARFITDDQYIDGAKTFALVYLALSLDSSNREKEVSNLCWLVGENRKIQGVAFSESLSYGVGECLSGCRRVMEELSEVRLEVPERCDPSVDGYLDGFDWDQVADQIIEHNA